MAFFETLMIKRTVSVEMIITLLQQMILCDDITDVSRNLTFIIFIADGNFMKLKTYAKFYNCGPSAELFKYYFSSTTKFFFDRSSCELYFSISDLII